jgi:hypothetical protein
MGSALTGPFVTGAWGFGRRPPGLLAGACGFGRRDETGHTFCANGVRSAAFLTRK